MCECGNEIGRNGRAGKCSPYYRRGRYADLINKPGWKDSRNKRIAEHRRSGKFSLSQEQQARRNELQRERRAANAAKTRAEKHQRRSFTETSLEYLDIIMKDPCVYCNGKADTIDHIIPIAHGGTNEWTNLAPACRSCNSSKGTQSLLTFLTRRV